MEGITGCGVYDCVDLTVSFWTCVVVTGIHHHTSNYQFARPPCVVQIPVTTYAQNGAGVLPKRHSQNDAYSYHTNVFFLG